MKKTIYIIIFISIFFLFFYIISSLFRSQNTSEKPNLTPTPTSSPYFRREFLKEVTPPPSTRTIPTIPSSQGGGVNTNEDKVEASTAEIKKVLPYLPIKRPYTLSTGRIVDIIISTNGLETRPWVLPVYIGGIDYTIPATHAQYAEERSTFLEAVNIIYTILKEHGAKPENMYINWGDRAFIQERAEQWLQEQ